MNNILKKNIYQEQGLATLEILIAMALIVVVISSVVPLVSGGQSTLIGSQINQEALYMAQTLLENARAAAAADFSALVTTPAASDGAYQTQTTVEPVLTTQCAKNVTSTVGFNTNNQALATSISTKIADPKTATALGGNCDFNSPQGDWKNPALWALSTIAAAKPTAIESLNNMVYLTGDKAPYLFIANTKEAVQGSHGNLFTPFANNFTDDRKLNDIAVARYPDGATYAFVARNLPEDPLLPALQFEVIDVTDASNPVSKAKRSLARINPDGSYPEGWRVYYYDKKVYIVTRETAGPELHIFDVENPTNPVEIGLGIELNRTVEDLVISQKTISGTNHYYIYLATDKNSAPLSMYDITYPWSGNAKVLEITSAEPSFSGTQDGQSIFILGTKLYFGRMSSKGAEVFIFNISNPASGSTLPLIASANVGSSVTGIFASGTLMFLATDHSQRGFQVWKFESDAIRAVNNISQFPDIITNSGVTYENGWIYAASSTEEALKIIYDP